MARQQGYAMTPCHRLRYLSGLNSSSQTERSHYEKMAVNMPIQGFAVDIIKTAMVKAAAQLQSAGLKSHLVLQIHDELILET